jgi:hypothetical protein
MEHKKKSGNLSTFLLVGLGVIVLALGIVAFYFYSQYQSIKKNPNQAAQAETEQLVAKVGKLIDLPKDETPTVATVLDKEKLAGQAFFANAENGDKILIYTKDKKAIVYRPSQNKLINVGPIAIDQKSQIQLAIVSAGGDTTSVTKKLEDKFAGTVAVSGVTDAKNKNSVKQLTVVDVSGQNADSAKQIAQELGGTVGSLPAGETAPVGSTIVVFVK